MVDTRFLEKHGRQYRVVVPVPRPLIPVLGKTRLKRGLKTDSLTVAQARRWSVVHSLRSEIEDAAARAGTTHDLLLREALEWNECVEVTRYLTRRVEPDAAENHYLLHQVIDGRRREVEAKHGALRAKDFYGIATGVSTPLLLHLERWLSESTYVERTKRDHRRALKTFDEWAAQGGWPRTVEAITRKVAGDFVSERLIQRGVHPKTANKLLSSLASYWRWLGKKVVAFDEIGADRNPWLGQWLREMPVHRLDGEKYKRVFSDDEVRILLCSKESRRDKLLYDFMLFAALTGARADEIARLKVGDCVEVDGVPVFYIRKSKTKAGRRHVPIHSALNAIVRRRTKGKPADAWLFDELPEQTASRGAERYMPLSKRFIRYRKDLGVHEQPDGRRQSRVDFHSFRRWFITKAEQADIPPHTIACVVGQERPGMTLGRYSAGASVAQMSKCVEAVKLPSAARL